MASSSFGAHQEIRRADVEVSPFDVHATTAMQLRGKFDPTGGRGTAAFLKVHTDAEGNTIVWRFTQTSSGLRIESQGDRAGILNTLVQQFPLHDGADVFAPDHPLLRRLANGFRGLRLMRVPWTFDIAAGAVLQQRVRWQRAYQDIRRIALRWGTRTPAGIAFPNSAQLAQVPVYQLEAMDIDPRRARALHCLARADARHRFLRPDADLEAVRNRLLSLPGIGPWTAALVTGHAYGDPDAVPLGDLHLPSLVTAALADESVGSDERMLELLQPYAGQRFRVIRLLLWASRRVPHILRKR